MQLNSCVTRWLAYCTCSGVMVRTVRYYCVRWTVLLCSQSLSSLTCVNGYLMNITAPFNKAHPTNTFFATVNQMFGGSSRQLPTSAECVVIKSIVEHSSDNIVGSWEELPNI